MTFKSSLLAGAALSTFALVAPAAHASILATITADYCGCFEDGGLTLTNSSLFTETNVTLGGAGPTTLSPGGSIRLDQGDVDDYGYPGVFGSLKIGGQTFSGGPFFNPYNGNGADGTFSGAVVGTITGNVPEPATLAVLGTALLGLGAARRRKG